MPRRSEARSAGRGTTEDRSRGLRGSRPRKAERGSRPRARPDEPALPDDRPVEHEPVRRVRAGREGCEELHSLACVQVQLRNAAAVGVDDELEPARGAWERLVAQRSDELVLHRPVERFAHHQRDVDVAAPVNVAAECARAGQVGAHEVVAERAASPRDQLLEVAASSTGGPWSAASAPCAARAPSSCGAGRPPSAASVSIRVPPARTLTGFVRAETGSQRTRKPHT